MYKNDFVFPKLFLSQGRGSRMCFRKISDDFKKNRGGAVIVNSDQGASKTVFSGAILMYALMQKRAHKDGYISDHMFDKVVFLSFSDNAKQQVENDFNKFLYDIDNVSIIDHDDFIFFSVNKQDLNILLENLVGNILMVVDEPQKGFTESDNRKNSKKKSSLYNIIATTPNIYKIFLTATPMKNSIHDMSNYIGPFLNKKIEDVTVEDIKNPDTYTDRVFFISSSIVNFLNRNIIFTRSEISGYTSILDNITGKFTSYVMKDESNRFLNTTKLEISNTQFKAISNRITKGVFGVGGISQEFLKLSSISGKEYENITGNGFGEHFDINELFEISPKMHYIYIKMRHETKSIKAIVKVNIYSEIFTRNSSNDGNTYLFDYFTRYPKHFEEFDENTGDLNPALLYYLNGFNKQDSVIKRNIMAYNALGEFPGASVLCFIPKRYATGFTYVRVRLMFLWDYGFHYSDDSQAWGRVTRSGKMPKGQQEAIVLEQDADVSSLGIQKEFKRILMGDLTEPEYNRFHANITRYYSKIDNHADEIEIDIKPIEKMFRKRFRALFPSYTRKHITHNKLRAVAAIENIMNSKNVLADYIDESKASQLFPLRQFVERGVYHQRKIEIDNSDAADPFAGDSAYFNIFTNHVENMLTRATKHRKYGLVGDAESDTIKINVLPI